MTVSTPPPPGPPALPGTLRLAPLSPFVGRRAELATLRTLVPTRPDDGRRIVLLGGEPGSGKSRLAREFAQEVAAQGVLVLAGGCDAVVHAPFKPFVEALQQLVRAADPDTLREDVGLTGGELTRLLPDLPLQIGELPPPLAADPDTARHRLHAAVGEVLARASRRRPILLVLEDGHWSDTPSLLLLRHLAGPSVDARMLLLATFRDTEADVPVELADTLVDLRRADGVVRLKLEGLSEQEVADFVRRSSGDERSAVDPQLVTSLCEVTDGNAFLLCELWRALAETGSIATGGDAVRLTRPLSEVATPDSIREVVSRRAARLDPATRDVLELAAVAGPAFDFATLAHAARGECDVAAALDATARSGLIEEVPSHALQYRFTHELVRRAIYDRLSSLAQAELHLRIGRALEAASVERLPELAHHFAAAAPLGERERAVGYNLQAAEAAARALAFDEAVERLRTALRIGIDDDRRRAEAQLALGSELYRAGASLDAVAAYREAARIARAVGDGELFASAAIGFEKACWRPSIHNQGALELLEEALALLPAEDSPLRVRLLAGLARTLDEFQADHTRGRVVRRSAIEMARRLDDRAVLASALVAAYWSDLPRVEVLEMLAEARDLAAELGDIELEAEAMEWRVAAHMVLGDIRAATEELAVVEERARLTRQPFILHVSEHYASALALLQGRLADAEAAAERSREWGRLLTGRDADGVYGIQMFSVRREQGRLDELASVVRVLGRSDREGVWRPGLAALLAELGMEDDAREELERIRRDGLERFRASLWLATLTYLADACAVVGDAELAALVYHELSPLSGASVMIGHGVACYGAADRYLGMLSATMGDHDAAERHFEAAGELNRRMGAATWLAHTSYEHGRMLLARGEAERPRRLLAEAADLAASIGLRALARRVDALAAPPSTLPDSLTEREAEVLRLVARGLSNREIGAALFISEHTAANHIRGILRKTRSANRTEAAAYAYLHGLAPG